MKEIAISRFKATCLAVLEEVGKSGKPVRITRFGKPVAEIVPPKCAVNIMDRAGSLRGTAEFPDELIEAPACDEDDWEALKR